MLKVKILFFLIFFSQILFSEYIWEVEHGNFGGDYATLRPTIALFDDDSFAVVAKIHYTDPWGQYENWDLLAKFDSYGELEWSVVDYHNLIGVIEIDNGCTITSKSYSASLDCVIKRDSLGEIVWEIEMSDFSVSNIVRLNNSEFVLIGCTRGQFTYSALRRMDIQGNIIWTQSYNMGGNSSYLHRGILTSDNCIVTMGRLSTYEYFVLKVDSVGNSLWSDFTQSGYNKWIFETSDNNLIVLSSNELIKYNLSGDILQTYVGDFDYGIDLPYENNFIVRDEEYGLPNIYKFDYDLNCILPINYFSAYYFLQFPNGDFLFAYESDFHFIRSDGELVKTSNNLIPNIDSASIYNFPNPFNPTTEIVFSIHIDSKVEISVYNIKGQKIITLANNEFSQGSHSIVWNGDDETNNPVGSGIYYYILNVNGKTEAVNKCLLLK